MIYIDGISIKKAFKYNNLYLFNYSMLKKELMDRAKVLKIKGRSKMTKEALMKAIMEIEGVEEEKDDKDEKKMKQPKIDEIYKVDSTPVKGKKVAKKADPSPKSSPRPSKQPKLSPKMSSQLKSKMAEVAAEGKK